MKKRRRDPDGEPGIGATLLGIALFTGVLMGFIEVCWTFIVPNLPRARHEITIDSIGRFIMVAIVADVALALTGAIALWAALWLARKAVPPLRTFRRWSFLCTFLLLAGGLSLLYRGHLYLYLYRNSRAERLPALAIGVLAIMVVTLIAAWVLDRLERRFGKKAPVAVWLLTIVALSAITVPSYLRHREDRVRNVQLPAGKIRKPVNILLVTLDTLRADHLACYGSHFVKTPVLDSLAADGHLFEAAFAQAPQTTPSHCSIMTSTYPARHGAFNGSAMTEVLPSLAEILGAQGYDTAAMVSSSMVRSKDSGLHHGFDYYNDSLSPYTSLLRHDEMQSIFLPNIFTRMNNDVVAAPVVGNRALTWLKEKRASPFFLWLHYFDVHGPYDGLEPHLEPYRDMYAGQIDPESPLLSERTVYAGKVTYTDAELGRVISFLKNRGLYEDTLIIVISDHGEAFGERHDSVADYYHHNLYDTTQHIPLIIKMPGQAGGGSRIPNIVQSLDLAPTLLEYVGLEAPPSFQGESLFDLLLGEERSREGVSYAETADPRWMIQAWKDPDIVEENRMLSVRSPDLKYIANETGERQELYELDTDPEEMTNTCADRRELCYTLLEDCLDKLGRRDSRADSIDPAAMEALRSLGYIR